MTNLSRAELAQHVGQLIAQDRNATHGDPHRQFEFAQDLKALVLSGIEAGEEHVSLGATQHEALDMICTKISRICLGSNLQDHWLDIAGYALIAAEGAERPLSAASAPAPKKGARR